MKTLAVQWVRDGSLQWEGWWLKRYGHQRTRVPGEADHISFANFDLRHNGLPTLREDNEGRLFIDVTPVTEANVLHLLQYHGFDARELGPGA